MLRLLHSVLVCLLWVHVSAAQLPSSQKVTIQGQQLTIASVVKSIKEQTGVTVNIAGIDERSLSLAWKNLSFWNALEELAMKTDSHLVTTASRIELVPNKEKVPSHIVGPFRLVANHVTARLDIQTGSSVYDIGVDLTWEPNVLVFRVDTVPSEGLGTTDAGVKLTLPANGSRALTSGHQIGLQLRPQGISRTAKQINLSGLFNATVADRLLTFTYDSAGKPTGDATQDGVSATITKSGPDGNDWLVRVELNYPKDGPKWESFEATTWRDRNTLRLIPPNGDPILPDTVIDEGIIHYVFKNKAKTITPQWKIDYRTPGPMREVKIPFELKQIHLP